MAVWMINWGLMPLGLLPLSATAEHLGTPVAMAIGGSLSLCVGVWGRQLWTLTAAGMEDDQLGADAAGASTLVGDRGPHLGTPVAMAIGGSLSEVSVRRGIRGGLGPSTLDAHRGGHGGIRRSGQRRPG